MAENMQRRRWQLYGSVQGVGFRYRAQYAASLLGLTGWVYNEYDGSVVLEAQGAQDALDHLLPTITKGSRWISIEDITAKDVPLIPGERRFTVRS